VAKLADALDLGSCTLTGVGVRLPPLAIDSKSLFFRAFRETSMTATRLLYVSLSTLSADFNSIHQDFKEQPRHRLGISAEWFSPQRISMRSVQGCVPRRSFGRKCLKKTNSHRSTKNVCAPSFVLAWQPIFQFQNWELPANHANERESENDNGIYFISSSIRGHSRYSRAKILVCT
jgi:hypothetical protein